MIVDPRAPEQVIDDDDAASILSDDGESGAEGLSRGIAKLIERGLSSRFADHRIEGGAEGEREIDLSGKPDELGGDALGTSEAQAESKVRGAIEGFKPCGRGGVRVQRSEAERRGQAAVGGAADEPAIDADDGGPEGAAAGIEKERPAGSDVAVERLANVAIGLDRIEIFAKRIDGGDDGEAIGGRFGAFDEHRLADECGIHPRLKDSLLEVAGERPERFLMPLDSAGLLEHSDLGMGLEGHGATAVIGEGESDEFAGGNLQEFAALRFDQDASGSDFAENAVERIAAGGGDGAIEIGKFGVGLLEKGFVGVRGINGGDAIELERGFISIFRRDEDLIALDAVGPGVGSLAIDEKHLIENAAGMNLEGKADASGVVRSSTIAADEFFEPCGGAFWPGIGIGAPALRKEDGAGLIPREPDDAPARFDGDAFLADIVDAPPDRFPGFAHQECGGRSGAGGYARLQGEGLDLQVERDGGYSLARTGEIPCPNRDEVFAGAELGRDLKFGE